jgi:hypothetical protein
VIGFLEEVVSGRIDIRNSLVAHHHLVNANIGAGGIPPQLAAYRLVVPKALSRCRHSATASTFSSSKPAPSKFKAEQTVFP